MSKPPKLSPRAVELLTLIGDYTDKDWTTGELRMYWMPSAYTQYSPTLRRGLNVGGPGDAACLRALARKGLTKHPRRDPAPYSFEITEDGLLTLQAPQTTP